MKSPFILDVSSFLSVHSIEYLVSDDLIIIKTPKLLLKIVTLEGCSSLDFRLGTFRSIRTITLFEDLWYTKGEIVKNRLLAILGKGEAIFARKCSVEEIAAEQSVHFLNKNHLLGSAKNKFKYGLIYNDQIVAVATFSAPRPMKRGDKTLLSYEWVRYANLGSCRVVGGMGKLLEYFVKEVNPQEVMSYADRDWSEGNAYLKLGFTQVGETPPIDFYVNNDTFERVSLKKLRNDRKYRSFKGNLTTLRNSGNLKFLRTFSLL